MDAVAQLGTGIAFGPLGRSSAMTGSLSGSAVDIRAEIEILFTRHHGEIYAYLARMTREPELAADLAQDTFVKAYRAYDDFEKMPLHGIFLVDGKGLVRDFQLGPTKGDVWFIAPDTARVPADMQCLR